MTYFTNLFNFHISREKIQIGRKPEFESEPQDKNPPKNQHHNSSLCSQKSNKIRQLHGARATASFCD
jgi:hypothetical protein